MFLNVRFLDKNEINRVLYDTWKKIASKGKQQNYVSSTLAIQRTSRLCNSWQEKETYGIVF